MKSVDKQRKPRSTKKGSTTNATKCRPTRRQTTSSTKTCRKLFPRATRCHEEELQAAKSQERLGEYRAFDSVPAFSAVPVYHQRSPTPVIRLVSRHCHGAIGGFASPQSPTRR